MMPKNGNPYFGLFFSMTTIRHVSIVLLVGQIFFEFSRRVCHLDFLIFEICRICRSYYFCRLNYFVFIKNIFLKHFLQPTVLVNIISVIKTYFELICKQLIDLILLDTNWINIT